MKHLSAVIRGGLLLGELAALMPSFTLAANADVTTIKPARIYTAQGDPIDGGVIIIRAGQIEAIGRGLPIPEDAKTIELPTGVATPGLIDACCAVDSEIEQAARSWSYGAPQTSLWQNLARRGQEHPDGDPAGDSDSGYTDALQPTPLLAAMAPGITWADQAAEVTPHRLAIDAVNLLSNDFNRLMKGGVTTVFVSPDSGSVIGCRGAIVKTAGPLAERIVRRADAVKATVGGDPSQRMPNVLPPYYGPPPNLHTRRPTTRMGVDWVFRKAFYDAQRARDGRKLHGADMPPAQALPVLQQILDGDIPLRIQARMQHDIFSALRLADEFKLRFILEEGTEAYRCLPQLKAANIPVIFGPLYMDPAGYRSLTDEVNRPRLNTPRQLAEAGIEFALTAQEQRDEDGLVRQGMYAVSTGLSAEQALQAVTATPARFLGLAGQVGVLAPGAAADLVVWSAEPFDATSRPLLVMINGHVVLEESK